MTPQEKGMIDDLVERIRSTPIADKDADAERYLQTTLAGIPDALYILTQTVLVQQYGLRQAQAALDAKQSELDDFRQTHPDSPVPARSSGSFLSRIFGSDNPPPAQAAPQAGYQPVNYAPASGNVAPPPPGAPGYGGPGSGGPAYGGPGYNAPGYGGANYGGPVYGNPAYPQGGYSTQPMAGFGGGGGFLHGALQTAAGVAAGELAFRGMEDLFRGFGGEGRGFAGNPGETVVNNYYGDDTAGRDRPERSGDDSSFYNSGDDASRQDLGSDDSGGAERGFGSFNGDDATADDANNADDSSGSYDDSSFGDGDLGDSGSGGGDDSNY